MITQVCDAIVTILESTTPTYLPEITLREASNIDTLENLPPKSSMYETTREFHVRPTVDLEPGEMGGICPDFEQEIAIKIRYQFGGQDADKQLYYLIGSDASLIYSKLYTASTEFSTIPNFATINYVESEEPEETESAGVWFVTHRYKVLGRLSNG